MSGLTCEQCQVKFECRDLLAMHMLEHSFISDRGKEGNTLQETGVEMRKGLRSVNRPCEIGDVSNQFNLNDGVAIKRHTINSKCGICQKVRGNKK